MNGEEVMELTREETLLKILKDLADHELKEFKWFLQKREVLGKFPVIPRSHLEKADRTDTVDHMLQTYSQDAEEVTKKVLRKLDRQDLVQLLVDPNSAEDQQETPLKCLDVFKSSLISKFSSVKGKKGSRSTDEIFTETVLLVQKSCEAVKEHDVQHLETVSRNSSGRLCYRDLFKPTASEQDVRAVLTLGVAGMGKTRLTQKLILEWAQGKAASDFQLVVPLSFRELNLLKDKQTSLMELLHLLFPEISEIRTLEGLQVLFILDGLDESRLNLDFQSNKPVCDVTDSASVDVLLTNLLSGKLLPSARLWITARPAAANHIPSRCITMVTEIRGFGEAQKLDYFRKLYGDDKLVGAMMSYIRTSRSLKILSQIPAFCWITVTAVEDQLANKEKAALPGTLTELYIHFLLIQSKLKAGPDSKPQWNQSSKEKILALGKLGFQQLQKGNLVFYKSDLEESGIKAVSVSVYTSMFAEIFREESFQQDKLYSFVHSSVQEFLAALYVHLTFINTGTNLLEEQQGNSWMTKVYRRRSNLLQTAVDRAVLSPTGHLDLFLRFLVGLCTPACQDLIKDLQTQSFPESDQESIKYIKEKLEKEAERSVNLLYCLSELNDRSLLDEAQLAEARLAVQSGHLTPAQWSALVFILLQPEEDLEVFELRKYSASEEGFLRLLPVIKAAKRAHLGSSNLSERSLVFLSTTLRSPASCIRELDLSNNQVEDSGVRKLSAGLLSPDCCLEILRLSGCNLSWRSCDTLASVISAKCSALRELDVGNNDLKDEGVQLLSAGLENVYCTLEILRLPGCQVTEEGCFSLASALTSNPSHLKELDLRYNHPGKSGAKRLSSGVKDQRYRLETLTVDHCGEARLKDGLRKYASRVELDVNTAHRQLQLSEADRKVTVVREEQPYVKHPERFLHCCWQVLAKSPLSGRSYWEVEYVGPVVIAVSYKKISRTGNNADCRLGWNDQCWSLVWGRDGYCFWHNKEETLVPYGYGYAESSRVAVYVDHPAGIISFYRVAYDNALVHLHSFFSTFTEPLFPAFGFGFGFWSYGASVTLCEL